MVEIVMCPRDPGVETALHCGNCGSPICPKCLITGPVGSRCKDCAKVMKSPIYTLSGRKLVQAVAVAIVAGIAMGLIWGLVIGAVRIGFFSIFVGAGLGWFFTRAMDWATGSKRGNGVVACAIGGILIAWGMQFLFVPPQFALWGLVVVAIGAYFAYQRLSRI